MKPGFLDKSTFYSPGSIHRKDCTTEPPNSFRSENIYDSTLSPNSDGSCVSVFLDKDTEHVGRRHIPTVLHRDTESRTMLPEIRDHSGSALHSMSISSSLVEMNRNPSRGGTVKPLPLSPVATISGPHDCCLNCGRRAKRARVETIIRGMTSSPGRHFTDVIATKCQREELDTVQENQACSSRCNDHVQRNGAASSTARATSPENRNQRKQLQVERPVEHLQARFTRGYDGNESQREDSVESVVVEESRSTSSVGSPETPPGGTFTEPQVTFERPPNTKYQGWKKTKLTSYIQSKPDGVNRLMADILKYELSRVVSMSVDSIFQNIPPVQRSPHSDGGVEKTDKSFLLNLQEQSPCYKGSESTVVQIPEVQTQALSLVVEKPPRAGTSTFNTLPQPPLPFTQRMVWHEDQLLENTLGGFRDGYPRTSQPRLETLNLPWNSVKGKVKSKVNSRSVRSPPALPMSMDPTLVENLCLPRVKTERDVSQTTVTNSPYVVNEGLTSDHLSKAKLMFFYIRYPSSTVLKAYFRDVQFTRCITSQLIKWFSNFREFYYIQMEKFARHAVVEGVADERDLSVGRESELFRALNLHYNKANNFQVPDRFLEVAEITLREFYTAVSTGKDSDPSWKKVIYKVISKLDSDIPADFKSHLLHKSC